MCPDFLFEMLKKKRRLRKWEQSSEMINSTVNESIHVDPRTLRSNRRWTLYGSFREDPHSYYSVFLRNTLSIFSKGDHSPKDLANQVNTFTEISCPQQTVTYMGHSIPAWFSQWTPLGWWLSVSAAVGQDNGCFWQPCRVIKSVAPMWHEGSRNSPNTSGESILGGGSLWRTVCSTRHSPQEVARGLQVPAAWVSLQGVGPGGGGTLFSYSLRSSYITR